MTSLASRLLDLPCGPITWLEAGEGPALLLLHGIGGHSGAWAHQLHSLASHHRVLAWDAPGYGGSAPLAGSSPTITDYVDRLAAWLDALGIEDWSGIGHSLGAIFLAALAGKRGRPSRAVLLHPMAGFCAMDPAELEPMRRARIADLVRLGARGFAQQRGRAILGGATPPENAARAIAVMAEVPQAGYLSAWEALCKAEIFPMLGALDTPTLVISGEEDIGSPPTLGQRIADALPQGERIVMPGIGHYASIEAPEMLDAILLPWLARAS